MKLGFVGCGAVARSLAPVWQAAGQPVVAVASRRREAADALAARLPGCRGVAAPADVVAAAEIVFLTVPDDAIAAVAAALAPAAVRSGAALVHCAGALDAAALPVPRAGALHPLASFPPDGGPLPPGVPFAVEAVDDALRTSLTSLALAAGGRPFPLPPGERGLYHAAATLACGGVTALVEIAARLFPGVDWLPLARAGVDNAAAGRATGPVVRGDAGTVRRHLAALGAADPQVLALYRDVVRCQHPRPAVAAAVAADEGVATVLRGKLHRIVVTQADLHYEGSITLDPDLLEAADIAPGEQVHVLDVDNGTRLATYAIAGERGSGVVGMNGPAARLVAVGDRVIVLSYVQVPLRARASVAARVVLVDAANHPREVRVSCA